MYHRLQVFAAQGLSSQPFSMGATLLYLCICPLSWPWLARSKSVAILVSTSSSMVLRCLQTKDHDDDDDVPEALCCRRLPDDMQPATSFATCLAAAGSDTMAMVMSHPLTTSAIDLPTCVSQGQHRSSPTLMGMHGDACPPASARTSVGPIRHYWTCKDMHGDTCPCCQQCHHHAAVSGTACMCPVCRTRA